MLNSLIVLEISCKFMMMPSQSVHGVGESCRRTTNAFLAVSKQSVSWADIQLSICSKTASLIVKLGACLRCPYHGSLRTVGQQKSKKKHSRNLRDNRVMRTYSLVAFLLVLPPYAENFIMVSWQNVAGFLL